MAAENERLKQETELLREEIRIKDVRMARIDPRRRPYYRPTDRMAILELKAARAWSLAQTANAFLLESATVASWLKRIDEDEPNALVQLRQPVNRFPDFIRYIVQRLRTLCPSLGKRKIAQMLARREEDVVGRLLAMLAGKDRYARYGACQALAEIGPRAASAAPKLRRLLADEDRWLRSLAIAALARMDPPTRKAITPDLMKVAAATDRADPRRRVSRAAGQALFVRKRGASQGGLLTESLDGVDRALLYAAVRAILRNEDAHARSYVGAIYSKLTAEDLRVLLPDIIRATREMAPSNVMFADGVRLVGLELLANLRIREGMKLCVELVEPSRWGFARRAPRCLACLRSYGGNARGLIGELRKLREAVIPRDRRKGAKAEMAVAIQKLIADIEGDADIQSQHLGEAICARGILSIAFWERAAKAA